MQNALDIFAVAIMFGLVLPVMVGYLYGRNQVDPDLHPEYYE